MNQQKSHYITKGIRAINKKSGKCYEAQIFVRKISKTITLGNYSSPHHAQTARNLAKQVLLENKHAARIEIHFVVNKFRKTLDKKKLKIYYKP